MTFDVVEDVKYFNTGVVKGFAVAETIIDGACLNISGISNNITELPDGKPFHGSLVSLVRKESDKLHGGQSRWLCFSIKSLYMM